MASADCGFDARLADRAVLHPELDVEQPQEMIDLGESRDRALVSAAAGALLDGHGGWNAEDGVDIGPRCGLHELPGVGVQGLEVTPLPLGEKNIESQGALAAPRHAGDHGESIETQAHVDVLEIVFAGTVNLDRGWRARTMRRSARILSGCRWTVGRAACISNGVARVKRAAAVRRAQGWWILGVDERAPVWEAAACMTWVGEPTQTTLPRPRRLRAPSR